MPDEGNEQKPDSINQARIIKTKHADAPSTNPFHLDEDAEPSSARDALEEIGLPAISRDERYQHYHEQDKRFILSKGEFAEKRFGAIKKSIRELKKQYPEVLSFCMFGSMVKGEAHMKSDIDGYLYVDAGQVKIDEDQEMVTEDEVTERGVMSTRFIDAYRQRYAGRFRAMLQAEAELSRAQTEQIGALPISRDIIDRHLNHLARQVEAEQQFEAQREIQKAEYLKTDPGGLFYLPRPETLAYPFPSANLTSMFHLEVGGGIGEYRSYLVTSLLSRGPVGRQIWDLIIQSTEMIEQDLKTGTNKLYPRSLEEAQKLYVK